MRHRLFAATVLAVLLAASGCVAPAVTPTETVIRGGGIKPLIVTSLSGVVTAPAGAVAVGGANVISAGGGNVIAAGGANAVAGGGANLTGRTLLALREAPLAGAEVYLADAAGHAIPRLGATRTDAQGRFQLFNVPKGYTFVVGVRIKTAAGKDATLQTLARPGERSTVADVGTASTLLTAAAVDGQADLGALDPAQFEAAVASTARRLQSAVAPELGDRAAVLDAFAQIKQADPALAPLVEAVRTSLRDTSVSLEALKQELAALERPEGLPILPDAGDAPAPSKPPVSPSPVAPEPKPAPVSELPVAVPPEPPAAADPVAPSPEPIQAVTRTLKLSPNLATDFFKTPGHYPMRVRLASVNGAFDRTFTLEAWTSKINEALLCGEPLVIVYELPSGESVKVQYVTLPSNPEIPEVLLPLQP